MAAQAQDIVNPTENKQPDSEVMLQRILAAVQKDTRRGWIEVAIAIVLSLATLASTWCGYQSRQWGGVQGSSQAGADTAERQAAENTIVGLQLRTFDGIGLLEYWKALREGDTKSGEVVFRHLRPELRSAIEASIAAGILTDPSVPGPLTRPEYALAVEVEAQRQREQAGQLKATALAAGNASGSYVVLTLMFASVLFLGGITGTLTHRRVRVGLASVALLLFIVTLLMLVRLPLCT